MTAPAATQGPPAWAGWAAAAFAAATSHLLIDVHLGLYGANAADMSVVKGAWIVARSLLWGWWLLLVPLAVLGRAGALAAVMIVTAVEAFLLDGLVAIVVAPPPSAAFPWQDITHVAALVTGGVAVWRMRVARVRRPGPAGGRATIATTAALIVVTKALSAPLTIAALSTPRA